jgi:acyl carrier protein
MVTTLEFFGGIAAIAFLAWQVRWSMRRRAAAKAQMIQETFSNRESLTPDAFYDRYFRQKGIEQSIVDGIRVILQEQLGADMSRLCAEDDFSKNLSFFWEFDSMADVELVLALEKHFQIKIPDNEAQQAHTVSELVHLVSNKVSANRKYSETGPH